jgi:hypothetical protein
MITVDDQIAVVLVIIPVIAGSHRNILRTMAYADDIVTYTAHCCFGDICGKRWRRLGRFATVEEARLEIKRHLLVSSKHFMTETEAMSHVQRYTKMGSEECCVQETSEGPLPEEKASSSKSARMRSRSRSGPPEKCPPNTRLLPAASLGDPLRYPVELPAYIEEDATVIEQSIQALDEIADYFATHAGNTTLEEVPQLLEDFRNIKIVLSAHVDQLRGVILNMRKYTI